jgi:hypothetical protein
MVTAKSKQPGSVLGEGKKKRGPKPKASAVPRGVVVKAANKAYRQNQSKKGLNTLRTWILPETTAGLEELKKSLGLSSQGAVIDLLVKNNLIQN